MTRLQRLFADFIFRLFDVEKLTENILELVVV